MAVVTAGTTHGTGPTSRPTEHIVGRGGEPNGDGPTVTHRGQCDSEFDRLLESVVADEGMRP